MASSVGPASIAAGATGRAKGAARAAAKPNASIAPARSPKKKLRKGLTEVRAPAMKAAKTVATKKEKAAARESLFENAFQDSTVLMPPIEEAQIAEQRRAHL